MYSIVAIVYWAHIHIITAHHYKSVNNPTVRSVLHPLLGSASTCPQLQCSNHISQGCLSPPMHWCWGMPGRQGVC